MVNSDHVWGDGREIADRHGCNQTLARIASGVKITENGAMGCVMPTRNVNLTEELDRFVHKKVKSGRYENASEVVRAALRSLEREEQQHDARIAALRAAMDEGDASGIADGDVFARVRGKLKLPGGPR
jgi:antitoxin ParD1/3/4